MKTNVILDEKHKINILRQVARDAGCSQVLDNLTSIERRMREEAYTIVVVGEFSRGKTSLVNHLLGADNLLPTAVPPTSAINHYISFGQEPELAVVTDNGEELLPFSKENLKKFTVAHIDYASNISMVKLRYPSDFLEKGVILLDTPGVKDINQLRAEIVYKAIPEADAIIFLMDASTPTTKTEIEFIQENLLTPTVSKIFFVLNKIDMLGFDMEDDEEDPVELSQEFAVSRLRELTGTQEIRVYPISLKNHDIPRFAELNEQFFIDLVAFINNPIRKQERKKSIEAALHLLASQIEEKLEDTLIGLRLDRDKVPEKLQEKSLEIANLRENFTNLMDIFSKEQKTIQYHIEKALDEFEEELDDSIQVAIQSFAGSVDGFETFMKTSVPHQVRRTLKQWVEVKNRDFQHMLQLMLNKIDHHYRTITGDILARKTRSISSEPLMGKHHLAVKKDLQVNSSLDFLKRKYSSTLWGTTGAGVVLGFLTGGWAFLSLPLLAQGYARLFYEKKILDEMKSIALANTRTAVDKELEHFRSKIIQDFFVHSDEIRQAYQDMFTDKLNNLQKSIEEIETLHQQSRETLLERIKERENLKTALQMVFNTKSK